MISIGVIGINSGGKKMFNGAASVLFPTTASSPRVGRKIWIELLVNVSRCKVSLKHKARRKYMISGINLSISLFVRKASEFCWRRMNHTIIIFWKVICYLLKYWPLMWDAPTSTTSAKTHLRLAIFSSESNSRLLRLLQTALCFDTSTGLGIYSQFSAPRPDG